MDKKRVALIISHPVQYVSPFLEKMSKIDNLSLMVYYGSAESVEGFIDNSFGVNVKWDIPLLKGYRYKFLRNYSPLKSVNKAPFGLINLGIFYELVKNKYDFVIVFGWGYVTYWLAFIAAIISDSKIILRSESPLNQELLKSKFKLTLKKLVFKFAFRFVDTFLAIGSQNAEFYKYYGVESFKIKIIPYSIDNARFINEAKNTEKSVIEPELPLKNKTILYVGKLIPKKRPFDLLYAFEKSNLKDTSLIFVGDGKLRNDMESYVSKKKISNVIFAGFKNQTEIFRYYKVANVFVLPSGAGETWGLVVNEAMCFKLPIIISDIPGAGYDLVEHGKNGYIYKLGEINSLREFLKKIINDSNLQKSMGEESFKKISAWSYEKGLEKLHNIITT